MTRLGIEEIFKIEDASQFYCELELHLFRRLHGRGPGVLSDGERAILGTWWLEAEVRDGGFDQYFANPTGDEAQYTLKDLERIGAVQRADLLRRALAVFEGGASEDHSERYRQMDTFSPEQEEQLEALSAEFQKTAESLPEIVFAYCAEHRAEFE